MKIFFPTTIKNKVKQESNERKYANCEFSFSLPVPEIIPEKLYSM